MRSLHKIYYRTLRYRLKLGLFRGFYRKKSDADILLGIGMLTQPLKDIEAMIRISTNNAILNLFFNFEYSPIYLYNIALYKGFPQAFPGTL